MADISKLVVEIDSNGVVKAVKNLNDFQKSSSNTEKSVNGLGKSLIKGGIAFGSLVTAMKSAIKFTKASLSAFAEFESVKTNLRVVTGSAEQAEKQFKSLKTLASETPFEVAGLANASIMLQQVGVDAENVETTLRMLGDAAGGNNELFNRIAQNYAQILSVGRASAMDMRQFAQMGLPVYQLMKDMGIQGQATADQVTEMFRRMTSEGGTFFNGMQLQANTLNGKISTLKDTWKDYLATFAETTGLSDVWKGVIDSVTKLIQENTNLMTQQDEMRKLEEGYLNGEIIPSYEYLTKLVEQYQNTLQQDFGLSDEDLKRIIEGPANDSGSLEQAYRTKKLELDAIKDQYEQQKKILELEQERIEENKRLVELQQQQAQEFQGIFDSIESEYNAKIESKLTDLQKVQKRINELDKLLSAKKVVTEEYGGKLRENRVDAFSDEQKAVIQALIDMLAVERNALRDNTNAIEEGTETENSNTETEKTLFEELEDAIKQAFKDKELGKAFGKMAEKEGLGAIQGTDVGNFVEGTELGGIWGGVFNTLLGALSNAIGGLEGINMLLNPITMMMKELAPTLKAILLPGIQIAYLIIQLGKVIQTVLNFLTFGLIDELASQWDELVSDSEQLSENTKNVNNNMQSLANTLVELQKAIDAQEKYYKEERLNLDAQNKYKVNDMILTPQGTFSTNPKDTIIATKNPKDLVSGDGNINVEIYNSQADNVNVTARKDEMGRLIIDISKKVATDYASGANGWDNAVGYRESKSRGRRLS